MTIEQAKQLKHRQVLHHVSLLNADKTPLRARVNGKPQTWKTRPNDIRVPMKRGLRKTFQMGNTYECDSSLEEWKLPE